MPPSLPLVTLIIPTSDRPRLLRQALRYASRQTYPNCEVVIVDDGRENLASVVGRWCERLPVRYVRVEKGSIGRHRNTACWGSRAEYVSHWDDDDWYPPDRIERQVRLLQRTGRGITGSAVCHVYDIAGRRAAYARTDGSVHGHTLLYRRELQTVHPFWDISFGEDRHFFHLNMGHRETPDDWDLVVYMMHGRNVTGPNRPFEWLPGLLPIVEKQIGTDLSFYEALRHDLNAYGLAAHAMLGPET